MSYSVKEIYYTLQGEGAYAVALPSSVGSLGATCGQDVRNIVTKQFVSFAIRILSAPMDLRGACTNLPHLYQMRLMIAGLVMRLANGLAISWLYALGEPLLQLDSSLIEALHFLSFSVAIETNEQNCRHPASIGSA